MPAKGAGLSFEPAESEPRPGRVLPPSIFPDNRLLKIIRVLPPRSVCATIFFY
jgi:hypothetical protein